MDKINVRLYGGKSIFRDKETPLEADTILCDRYNECSFYKENKCLRCRSFLASTCKFGLNNIVKGYTRRAAKYYDFKSRYESDEKYAKLNYPSDLVALMGDTLYMNLKFTLVRKRKVDEEKAFSRAYRCVDGYEITEVGFCSGDTFVPLSDVTVDLLYGILSYEPHAMMGGVIEDYQAKVVPEIVQGLKKVVPNIHKAFIKKYPEFDKAPNYVGKYAYIKTMVEGSELVDHLGNKFTLRGGKLFGEFHSAFVPFDGKVCKMEIEVTDDMKYKITRNSQCDSNTKFS